MHLSHNDHEGEEKGNHKNKRMAEAKLAATCKTFILIEVSQGQAATKQCRNLVLIEAALFRFARQVQVSLMT